MPFSQQLRGLHNGLLDIGFALSGAVNDGLVAEHVWTDQMSVILPARHLLLAHPQIKLNDALKFPLVLCYPEAVPSCEDQIRAALGSATTPLNVVDRGASLGMMLILVGAGFGICFAITQHVKALQRPDIVTRPLADTPPMLSTFLLRRRGDPSEPIGRFLQRVQQEFASHGEENMS